MGSGNNSSSRKIRILVTFIQTHVGGAMTSLVNFLNALDCDKYEVDLLFYENSGGRHGIKREINILPQARSGSKYDLKNICLRVISPSYMAAKLRELYYKKVVKNRKKAIQIIALQGCKYSNRLDKEYDIAIAYEFAWCLYYTANYVKAKRKIMWHHLDYEAAGLDFKIDKKAFDAADALVFVSEDCMKKFVKNHSQYKSKSVFIPNLLSSEYVRSRGEETVELPFEDNKRYVKMLSVSRIDFNHKGLDRGVRIVEKLCENGLADNLRWMIIGKGKHLELLRAMINEKGLGEYIYPVGLKENPIPYMKKFDFLFLPSRYEGKPMVVTEAQIMGLVPVVSSYTSAHEQINNGVDGIICNNDEDSLYRAVESIVKDPSVIDGIREHLNRNDYGNEREICRFDELVKNLLDK